MNPSQAMGTFLRTWRAEWAGLSRAQLANAVTAHLPGGKKVTTHVIREWEAGQAPKSTEEFDALCLVMRVRDLTEPEVRQFRQAVLAAVCDRQYPGMFDGDGIARRPDVHDIAHRIEVRNFWDRPGSIGIVQLVASLVECEVALRGGDGYPTDAQHDRRLREAVAWLRRAMEVCHSRAGRNHLVVGLVEANLELVESVWGKGGLGHPLTPIQLRAQRPIASLMALLVRHPRPVGANAPYVRELRRISEQADADGNRTVALYCLHKAAAHSGGLPSDECDWLYAKCLSCYDEADDLEWLNQNGALDHDLYWASWREGRLSNVEILLQRMEPVKDRMDWAYENCLLWYEAVAGSPDEAERIGDRIREGARQQSLGFMVKLMDVETRRRDDLIKRENWRERYRKRAHVRAFPAP